MWARVFVHTRHPRYGAFVGGLFSRTVWRLRGRNRNTWTRDCELLVVLRRGRVQLGAPGGENTFFLFLHIVVRPLCSYVRSVCPKLKMEASPVHITWGWHAMSRGVGGRNADNCRCYARRYMTLIKACGLFCARTHGRLDSPGPFFLS